MSREIAGRRIGADAPVFVVAEIGLNHGGSTERALEMVDAAAWAGASAIKLQSLHADRLVAESCPAPAHVAAASLRQFFGAFELDAGAHRAIVQRARVRGLAVMSTPFSEQAVPMLEGVGIDAYKIASGDLTYDHLIAAAATTGRPVIISTGMSTMPEVIQAVATARRSGALWTGVLHCVSAYPTPLESENLAAIGTLQRVLGVPVGLSDHGTGAHSAVTAVALGAVIYERHLMLEGDVDAIDAPVSSTPTQLKQLIAAMEQTRRSLGDGRKVCQPAEAANVVPSRRALYAARDLRAGERVDDADVVALRPARGLPPSALPRLIGTRLDRNVAAGTPFMAADLALEQAS